MIHRCAVRRLEQQAAVLGLHQHTCPTTSTRDRPAEPRRVPPLRVVRTLHPPPTHSSHDATPRFSVDNFARIAGSLLRASTTRLTSSDYGTRRRKSPTDNDSRAGASTVAEPCVPEPLNRRQPPRRTPECSSGRWQRPDSSRPNAANQTRESEPSSHPAAPPECSPDNSPHAIASDTSHATASAEVRWATPIRTNRRDRPAPSTIAASSRTSWLSPRKREPTNQDRHRQTTPRGGQHRGQDRRSQSQTTHG